MLNDLDPRNECHYNDPTCDDETLCDDCYDESVRRAERAYRNWRTVANAESFQRVMDDRLDDELTARELLVDCE